MMCEKVFVNTYNDYLHCYDIGKNITGRIVAEANMRGIHLELCAENKEETFISYFVRFSLFAAVKFQNKALLDKSDNKGKRKNRKLMKISHV